MNSDDRRKVMKLLAEKDRIVEYCLYFGRMRYGQRNNGFPHKAAPRAAITRRLAAASPHISTCWQGSRRPPTTIASSSLYHSGRLPPR